MHAGFVGGGAANVSPAVGHEIGQAVTVIDKGDLPVSNTGEGSFPAAGGRFVNLSVAGSMAYCHATVASNWRSAASDCWLFLVRTFWLRVTNAAALDTFKWTGVVMPYCQMHSAAVHAERRWSHAVDFL